MKPFPLRRGLASGQGLTSVLLLLLAPALARCDEPSHAQAAACLAYAAVVREIPELVTPVQPAAPVSVPSNYRDAYALYQSEQRPMVVMVTASWCPYCPAMKKELLQLQRAGRLSGVSLVIVDHDQDRALARSVLGVRRSLPALSVYHYVDGKAKESRPKSAGEIAEMLAPRKSKAGTNRRSAAGPRK